MRKEVEVSYEEFVSARLAALARYAVMLTGDTHLAEDLLQETMVRVQLKWRRVARVDSPEPYVKRMMVNLYLDWRRGSWWTRVFLSSPSDDSLRVPLDHAEEGAERDVVWQALAELPKRQRAAVVLRYYEDLPDREIAEILGCTVSTVRSNISRALATLRQGAASLVPGAYR
jgi:RNA polymerase sigma-70 factor (sigma-E family)